MRCWGRTSKLMRRCSRQQRGPFCHSHRFQPLTATIAIVGLAAAIAGLFVDLPQLLASSEESEVARHPPQLGRRLITGRDPFVNELGAVVVDRERVRIGCAATDEHACLAASEVLKLFELAGWPVASNGVERVQLTRPARGVVLLKRGVNRTPQPPATADWVHQTPSLVAIKAAFRAAGIPTTSAADAAMPEGVIGVYVGPD